MVCNHSDRNVILLISAISHACQFTDPVTDRFDRIHIEDRIHFLDYDSQTLKPHSSINIFIV